MRYFSFTNSRVITKSLDEADYVDTIFIDLEIIGKEVRQANTNSLISKHTFEDLEVSRDIIKKSDLGVRINPLNPNSENEINKCISGGVDVIMLPMFDKPQEVVKVLNFINNRCALDLLFETPEAISKIKYFPLNQIRFSHFGLNDLSIALKSKHMFEVLFNETLINAANYLNKKKYCFGFGGVGVVGSKPFAPELIFTMHKLLSSNRCILSRAFLSKIMDKNQELANKTCKLHLEALVSLWNKLEKYPYSKLMKNKRQFLDSINSF